MQPSWLPTLLLIPFLYGIGWLLAQPIARPGWSAEDVSLLGTLLSFLLFLVVLPSWIQVRCIDIRHGGCVEHPLGLTLTNESSDRLTVFKA